LNNKGKKKKERGARRKNLKKNVINNGYKGVGAYLLKKGRQQPPIPDKRITIRDLKFLQNKPIKE
jgi:hypothetical protein